jgi:hypothetical protein
MEKALYFAWQTTIHVGMEVWIDITRHNRSPQWIIVMQDNFFRIWAIGGIFATTGHSPKWKIIPPDNFLPFSLATEPPRKLAIIPLREESTHDTESISSLTLDLYIAIDDLFKEVLQDLAEQAYSLDLSQRLLEDVPPPTPSRGQAPAIDIKELLKTRCLDHYSVGDFIKDSSPRTASNIQLVFQ